MRTPVSPSFGPLWLLAATAALGACKWTEFDDLSNETWVGSTEKPSIKSSDYGVAIQRGTLTSSASSGGTLVVIGANQATYSQLIYGAGGDSKLASNTLELNTQFGIAGLDPQPIVLANPASDDTALIVNGGGSQILALIGTNTLDMHDLFVTPSNVDGATYMQPPPRSDAGHIGEVQPQRPLIASGDVVIGAFVNPQPNPHPTCKLVDGTTAIAPRALGVVRNGAVDDVLAWGANGKLYRYPSSVFLGCASPVASTIVRDVSFIPNRGSQILSLDATHVLLQGHHDNDDASLLQVFDASVPTALTPVGGSVSLPKLRSAAIYDTGTTKYVVAGYPGAVVAGKTSGQVLLFKVSAATGIESAPATTFNDAQPDDNESFGRSVAVMPFNGKAVIAVAADNEIFMYYRANLTDGTPLYGETRQGR